MDLEDVPNLSLFGHLSVRKVAWMYVQYACMHV